MTKRKYVTRYTVQYWYNDEHDVLMKECDTLQEAYEVARNLPISKYKDIEIYGRHYQRVNYPFEHDGIIYDDWTWVLVNDDYVTFPPFNRHANP